MKDIPERVEIFIRDWPIKRGQVMHWVSHSRFPGINKPVGEDGEDISGEEMVRRLRELANDIEAEIKA